MKRIISLILVIMILFTTNIQYVFANEDVYTDEVIVAMDTEWLTSDLVFGVGNYDEITTPDGEIIYYNITGNLNLPLVGENGSSLVWSSSDETFIEANGVIHKPSYLEGYKMVVVTATLKKGTAQAEKLFVIELSPLEPTADEQAVQADYDWLIGENVIYYGRFYNDIRSDVTMPTEGENGSTINWSSSDERWIAIDGTVVQPPFSFAMGNAPVTLSAIISSGTVSKQKTFELEVVAQSPTDVDNVAIDKEWLTYENILNGNSKDNVKTRLSLPTITQRIWSPSGYYGGSDITWKSSNPSVIAVDGSVNRPTLSEGNQTVTLTATISYGGAKDTKTFSFVVTAVEEFPLAIMYDSFDDSSRLQFNGISGTVVTTDRDNNEITALQFNNDRVAEPTTGGSIFTKNKIRLGDDLSFSTVFSYKNPHPDFTKGEGGFIFTLQTVGNSIYDNAMNDEDVKPSFNIAFNTDYYSTAGSGQATYYGYIEKAAVYYNGDYEQRTEQYLTSEATNDPPTYNNVWIEYDGASKVLEVRFSKDGIRPVNSNLKLDNLELAQILTSAGDLDIEDVREVYVGFMGSMGNAKDKTEIGSLYFKNDCTPIDFAPYNFIDLSNVNLIANPPAGQASTTMSAIVCSLDGTPVADIPVYFTTSFGMLDSSCEVTDASGYASTVLYSGTSGTAQVKAYTTGGAMALAEVQLSANDTDRLSFDSAWLTGDRIKGENTTLSSVTVNLNLPLNAPNGSTISWESNNSDFLNTNGVVTRSSITQGDQSVTLIANISIGAESTKKTFDITIKVCDEDLANADKDWLTDEIIIGENESRNKIISDLTLPTIGENGSSISWKSDLVGVVDLDGTVTRPSFTQGNQSVTLTATVKMGEVTLERTFNITVIALKAIDEEIAYADFEWLKDEIIRNENVSLDDVLSSLTLPTVGVNGSQISWESTNQDFVKVDGTINRPTFSQGTQSITLKATISKGSSEYTKTFNILVFPLATNAEALSFDNKWLNYDKILGENSINYVTVNLNLPVLGPNGSTIIWKSSNETYIKPDGTVNRPTFTQGNKTVRLTASISKGGETIDKIFLFSVKNLEQTDLEAIASDKRWLQVSRTLGGNLSQYSINQNLSLPTLAPNGSLITWVSDMPSVITPSGEITIPEYREGHKNVVLTATIEKGGIVESGTYKYAVLSKPDTFLPVVMETTPINNSDNVLWNTREITIIFDENIKALTPVNNMENYGITLNGSETPKISVSIFKNKLTVNLMDYLEAGTDYHLIVPPDTISDKSDNYLDEELNIEFSVEQKPERNIEVIYSLPNDKEKEISAEVEQISFKYNYSDITKGAGFEGISLLDISGNKINIAKSIANDTVTLTLETGTKLQSGSVYEVAIPAGSVVDRFENSSARKSIKFRTKSSNTMPTVVGHYPVNGQTDVDIYQPIEINFSESVNVKDLNLILLDNTGKRVNTYIRTINDSKTVLMEVKYYYSLKPNTLYTVRGSYDSLDGNSYLGFEMSFTTGAGTLNIINALKLSAGDFPINTPIEIPYSASVSRGANFDNIQVLDSSSNPVEFNTSVVDNKIVLTPASPLNTSETYELCIPKGAVKNQAGIENDAIKFFPNTASRLNYGSYSFYMPSTWVTEKVLSFNARWLGEISRTLKSITWDFGDGNQGSGLFPTNVYSHAGNYKVTLTLVDNKDISYIFEQNITINGLNLDDVKISVYPNDNCYFTVFEENNQYGLKNLEPFSITLYSPSIGYISDETVKVNLHKNGVFLENLGNVKTKYNGEAEFSFSYGNKGYFGGYELVFEHDGSKNQKIRVPVTFYEETKKQSMTIQLYNQEEGGIIDDPQDMYFDLNGKKVLAKYEKIDGWAEGCYVINGLETGAAYLLKLSNSEDVAYVSDEQEVYHRGSADSAFLAVRVKQPGLNYIKSALTDSRVRYKFKGLFINNISIPNLNFELDGDWDGLTPGYYELKSSMGSISLKSDKPVFELQPGLQMKVGEELWGRMVSKSGVSTLWQNAYVIVAPYPTLDNGFKLDVSYINGKYIVDSPITVKGLTGGKVNILDGVPLLDSAQSFGLGSSTNRFEGSINENGLLKLLYKYSSGHGMSTKKSKTLTTGYEVETDITFYGSIHYDRFNKEWKFGYYYYYLSGRGEYYWKRPYTIPKLDIGGWGKVAMCPNIDAKLAIYGDENKDKDFEGILEFNPSVYVSIGAGIENVLSVEGYVTGDIPAEFHIPTGYIQVEPSISAGIDVYYVYDSSELYYKEIASTHWDNGKEKVKLLMRQFVGESKEDDIQLAPTARNYLERGSQWLVGSSKKQNSRMMSFKATDGEEDINSLVTMTENIYPRAEVQQINGENDQWLVWTDDNPIRDANNRTQLKYSVNRDGSWLEPEWFGQDDTADFAPVAADSGDGLFLAWQNIKNVMTEENKNVSYVTDSEISVTNSPYKANGNESDIITLTDDDKFDHSPVIAADNTNAILVWTKSEGLSLTFGEDMDALQSPANSDCLYSSFWDGNDWSTPEEIEGSLPTILDSSLTMHNEEGLLTYTLDMDNDLLTQDDREVYYRIYDGTAWGDAICLSNNNIEDLAPKAVNINNEWFIIWQQNGSLVYKAGLSEEAKTDEFLSEVPNNYKIVIMEGADPQLAVVYTNTNSDNTISLSTSFYDIKKGIWSNMITLSENAGYIRSFSPIFTKEGKLDVVYTKAEVITKVIEEISFLSPSDKVNLMLLSYTPKHDIALDEDSNLQLTPSIPVKGALTTVSAVVKNLGDFAENATLYLYDGNPADGKLLGETATTEPIAAGSTAQLDVEWLVGLEDKSEYELYAIVRPDGEIHEVNENNNTLSLKIATSDIAVVGLDCENIAKNDYLAKATVANTGSTIIEDVDVQVVHEKSGKILEFKSIDQIMPGQKIDLSFLFTSDGLIKDGDGEINMYVCITLKHAEEEYSTENNIYRFTLEQAAIKVDKIEPSPNETQINIEKPITISFNMNVEPGSKFAEIELYDDDLNEVDINKALNGRILTITPQSSLSYKTGYTLTLPVETVSDSYGHTMNETYSQHFVTTSSNPEIIFAYPGDGMVDIALDTELKVKFNQNVMSGQIFDNIAMYTEDSKKVSISTLIDGEWLYINLASHLNGGSAYSLVIPRGAVKNANNEMIEEDYILNFTTIGAKDDENDNTNKSDSHFTQQEYKVSKDEKGIVTIDITQQALLKAPFTISIPYTPTTEEMLSPESIVIRYVDNSGNLVVVPDGHYDSNVGALIFNVTSFSRYVVGFNKVDFSDVASDAWYRRAVSFIAARGITTGTGYGKYSPDAKLTRSDFLVLLMRSYSITPDANPTDNFVDSGNTYYTNYLATAKRLGITEGVGNNMFSPEREITRQEMFTLLYNALEVINRLPEKTSVKTLSDFTDEKLVDSWAKEALTLLIETGTISGNAGKLSPTSTTTRAEMAQVLYNLLSR